MGSSLLLLALPVLLQSVITEANVECFSNVMPNDTGIASNGACQISYILTKVNGCDVITGEPRLSAVGRHHQKVLLDPSAVIVLDRCRFDGNSIVCNCETNFCNQNFYSLWNLKLDNMKFLMQKVCPPLPYEELISSSLRLTKD